MANRTFRTNISSTSIKSLIDDLRAYKRQLQDKNELFVKRLAELGLPVIDNQISMSQGDSNPTHYTYIKLNRFQGYSQATLIVEGQDILFIEFGAGTHYNGKVGDSPHPKGAERGYTIGSYGHGLGANDYWYYVDDQGISHRSYGTQSTAPVYTAGLEMRAKIKQIAKEVFG